MWWVAWVFYLVPNTNQCANCHASNGVVRPFGNTAQQLNLNGQLHYFENLGLLEELPLLPQIPKIPDYMDASTGNLETRARTYLDINCGHCYSPEGTVNSSGLYLQYSERDPHAFGVWKHLWQQVVVQEGPGLISCQEN